MGIRRSSAATKSAPDADAYATPTEETEYENYNPPADEKDSDFEAEDENEIPSNAGIIQSGWEAAEKRLASSTSSITSDFKVTGEDQLIKFLTASPHTFMQHWIEREGKRSFICLGADCPLCTIAADKPSLKMAFQVVNLSSDDEVITPQWWITGTRVAGQLSKYHKDPKVGPLDRGYFSVSKTGVKSATVHSINPIKERDLADDWDLDVAAVKSLLAGLDPLDKETLRASSKAELLAIAKEIA